MWLFATLKGFFYHSFGRKSPFCDEGGKSEIIRRPDS